VDYGLRFIPSTPRCQGLYQVGLVRILADAKTDLDTQRFAIARLARLAFARPEPLLSLTRDARQTVRELAVRQLAWLDSEEALPTLLQCLGDERARWAIYALRRLFAELPHSSVLQRLRSVPMQKVTVAKEVVRLIGDLGGDAAFEQLLELEGTALHRDVRIAVLRALWNYLERDATWQVFERAAADPDWVIASRLADVPHAVLSVRAEARLCDLYAAVLRRPEPEARIELLRRATSLPLADADRRLMGVLLRQLHTTPQEAQVALRAVLYRMHPNELEQVASEVALIASQRELMAALVPVLRPSAYSPGHIRQLAKQILHALSSDAFAVPLRIDLAAAVLDYAGLARLFRDISQNHLLHYDAMHAAVRAIDQCVQSDALELELASAQDPRLRSLGLAALVRAASPPNGWTRDRRDRLVRYQSERDALVAGAAAYVFPPREPPEPAN
jgi:HEAT repeat protein